MEGRGQESLRWTRTISQVATVFRVLGQSCHPHGTCLKRDVRGGDVMLLISQKQGGAITNVYIMHHGFQDHVAAGKGHFQ